MRRGEGSVVRHGDGWRVFVTTERGRVSKVVHGTKRDAERELRAMLKTRPSGYTVGELCEDYVESVRRRQASGELAASTAEGYVYVIGKYIAPEFADLRVEFLKPARVRKFIEGLPANQRSVFKTFRQMMNWAERSELVEDNPFRKLQSPPPSRTITRTDVYDAAEVRQILEAVRGAGWLEIAVLVALGGGLRRGEICALDWEDFKDGVLAVSKSYGKDAPKTWHGNRSVRLPDAISATLEGFRGSGAMIQQNGLRIHPDGLTHAWVRFCRREGIRYLPFKNLRHTSLTLAYEATGDIYAVSRRAGHAGIGITTKYYARPDERIDAGVAEAMGNVLDGE